jgi:hypothetical protein
VRARQRALSRWKAESTALVAIYKCSINGRVAEQAISGDAEFTVLLKKHFGLDLDEIRDSI